MRLRNNGLIGCWSMMFLLCVITVAECSDLRVVEAAKEQDQTAIRALLKQRVDVNVPQPDGSTALHWATYWDDATVVEWLLRAGARVNATNDDGATPLYLACINRNAAIVERLLTAGGNPNAALPSGESALMTAARTGSVEIVRALLARGADVNVKEHTHGQTALMWAVAYEHPDVAQALIEAGAATDARSDVRHRVVNVGSNMVDRKGGIALTTDLGGLTPLLFAARTGNVALAKLLVGAGANVNDVSPSGVSALALAAHSGHGPFAAVLLEHGADPNADGAGYTALHAAVLRGDLPLVKALLARGANPNAELTEGTAVRYSSRDFHLNAAHAGATPYWLAAKYGEAEIMHVLVAHGADPRRAAKDGTSPLLAAVTGIGTSVVQIAMDRRERVLTPTELAARGEGDDERITLEAARVASDLGADPNVPNRNGDTALTEAATRGYESVVRLLLEKGADVNAATKAGDTPLHNAAARGYVGIIRLLVDKGANLQAKNEDGKTPLATTGSDLPARFSQIYVSDTKRKAAAALLLELGAKE